MEIINAIALKVVELSCLGICFFGMALDSPSDIPVRMVIIFTVLLGVSLYIYHDSERRM